MSRDAMLSRIRKAIHRSEGARHAELVAERLAAPRIRLQPARALRTGSEARRQFLTCLEQQATAAVEVAAAADIPAAVAAYLSAAGAPPCVRLAPDSRLAGLPWEHAAGLAVTEGRALPSDAVGLSHALAGVAETGTLVCDSGSDNPTSLAFLPEIHLVALSAAAIVGSYEAAIALLRERYGRHVLPRSVNFISGPSRTGDIGGRIVFGAHGPRRLAVFLYG